MNAKTLAEIEALCHGGEYFRTQVAKKRATALVGREYDKVATAYRDALIASPEGRATDAIGQAYWSVPDLHRWNARHAEAATALVGIIPAGPARDALEAATAAFVDAASELRSIRDDIASTPVEPVARVERAGETAVRETVKALHARRRATYLHNVSIGEDLYRAYGIRLNVAVSSHYVMNAHGTMFVRSAYYLDGRRQALNVIVATMEQMGAIFGDSYFA